jgi:hypothetical protein
MTIQQHLGERVTGHLACLLGKPLWGCGRAADLLWLQFGERHVALSLRGRTHEVGEYALHIQCAWRIACQHGVVSASDLMSAGRIDSALSAFVNEHCPALVENIVGDDRGRFSMSLAGGCTVHVLPQVDSEEQWRLLQPGKDVRHVVLEGTEVNEI